MWVGPRGPRLVSLGPDAVHQRDGGNVLGWHQASAREFAHPGKTPLAVRVRVLVQGCDPQTRPRQRRDYFPESPAEQVDPLGVPKTRRALQISGRCEAAAGRSHIVADALLQVHGLSARGIISGAVPITIQNVRHRVKVDENEASAGLEDSRDAPGPGCEIRKPADDAVRGEDVIETPAFARGLL